MSDDPPVIGRHLREHHPELYRDVTSGSDDVDFAESSGFQQSSRVYDLLVASDDRRMDSFDDADDAEIVVHMGCHVLKTPHIIDATLDILQEMGYSAVPLGGFGNCCGIQHISVGDFEGARRVDDNRFSNAAELDPEYFLTECTSCYATTAEISMEYRSPDFDVLSMVEFLASRTDELVGEATRTDDVRVAIHDHYDPRGWTPVAQAELVRDLFSSLPGVEVVEMAHGLETGLPCNYRSDPREHEYDDLSERIFREAVDVGADYLVNFWHACHRHLVAYDYRFPVDTVNYTTFLAERLGYSYDDAVKRYTEMGMTGDIDGILDDARPAFEANGLSESEARAIAEEAFTESIERRAES